MSDENENGNGEGDAGFGGLLGGMSNPLAAVGNAVKGMVDQAQKTIDGADEVDDIKGEVVGGDSDGGGDEEPNS